VRTLVELEKRPEDAPLKAIRKPRVQIWDIHKRHFHQHLLKRGLSLNSYVS
jgi:hypothetical protein